MEEPPSKKIKVNEDSLTNLISVEILPREILYIIFSYLDKKSVQSTTATCKLWFELIRNDSNLSSHVCFKAIKLQEFDKRIQDLEISVARWPVLKTIKFCGHYPYFSVVEKLVQRTTKLVNSKDCPPLEKIIVSVSYCLERFFPHLPDFGTIEEFTFNPKDKIISLQLEHITSLGLELNLGWKSSMNSEIDIEEKKVLSGLELIGATACNLKQISIRSMTFYKQKEVIERFRKIFQDITDVKIQFYLMKEYPSKLLATIIKKPYQNTTVISKWH